MKEAAQSATAAASPNARKAVETVKDVARIIRYFRNRAEVSALYLFGSLGRDRARTESDIDIALLIDESRMGSNTFTSLKKMYYAATPSFSLRPVDIVILNSAPTFLKYQVLKTGKILFDRKRKLRVQFTERAIIEYLDFKPVQDICLNAISRRLRSARNG
jgi:predicted nucleotidyltransferase